MAKKNLIGTISLVFLGVIFGAVLVSGFGWVRPSLGDIHIGADKPPVEKLDVNAAAFNDAFVNVAQTVTPSIVQITVVTSVKNRMPEGFFLFPI
jgi:serine protease Do